jgi:hypothetical protein
MRLTGRITDPVNCVMHSSESITSFVECAIRPANFITRPTGRVMRAADCLTPLGS